MTGSYACYSSCWNPSPASTDELASASPIKRSGTFTPIPIMSCTPTPALAAAFAPSFTSATTNLAAKYLGKDLQGILKTILKARAPALQPKSLCERPLKARAPDLYRGKTHMKYYNFCRQCEDHFATAHVTGLNCILFATTFLKNQVLFRWQQHQRKLANKTNVLITYEKFKAFLCCNLGEVNVFVDSIWNTIQKDL